MKLSVHRAEWGAAAHAEPQRHSRSSRAAGASKGGSNWQEETLRVRQGLSTVIHSVFSNDNFAFCGWETKRQP